MNALGCKLEAPLVFKSLLFWVTKEVSVSQPTPSQTQNIHAPDMPLAQHMAAGMMVAQVYPWGWLKMYIELAHTLLIQTKISASLAGEKQEARAQKANNKQ